MKERRWGEEVRKRAGEDEEWGEEVRERTGRSEGRKGERMLEGETAGKEAAPWNVFPGEKESKQVWFQFRALKLTQNPGTGDWSETLFPVSPTLLSWNPGSSLHSSPPPE